jgi:hypothetical protein
MSTGSLSEMVRTDIEPTQLGGVAECCRDER